MTQSPGSPALDHRAHFTPALRQWNGYASALELCLRLRQTLGSPSGMT